MYSERNVDGFIAEVVTFNKSKKMKIEKIRQNVRIQKEGGANGVQQGHLKVHRYRIQEVKNDCCLSHKTTLRSESHFHCTLVHSYQIDFCER